MQVSYDLMHKLLPVLCSKLRAQLDDTNQFGKQEQRQSMDELCEMQHISAAIVCSRGIVYSRRSCHLTFRPELPHRGVGVKVKLL